MKKHLEYLRNGTALVTIFVERAFKSPRRVMRPEAGEASGLTPQQAEALAYVNAAETPEERRKRKVETHSIMYGAGALPSDISLAFPSAKLT